MAKKKHYEYRETKQNRDSDGLRQRRLKEEARWKFNPNADYSSEEDNEYEEEDWSEYDDQR